MLLKYSLPCVRVKLFLSHSLCFLLMGEEYVDPQEHFLLIHFSLSSDLQVWSWLFTTPRLPIDFKEQDSVGAVWKSPNKGFQEEAAEFISTGIYIDLEDADRFAMASTTCGVNWSGTTKRRRTMQSSPSVCGDNPSFLLLSVLTAEPPLPAPGWEGALTDIIRGSQGTATDADSLPFPTTRSKMTVEAPVLRTGWVIVVSSMKNLPQILC